MSFSSQVKHEITINDLKKKCCRSSFMCGLVFSSVSIDGGRRLKVNELDTAEYIRSFIASYLRTDITLQERTGRGKKCFFLDIPKAPRTYSFFSLMTAIDNHAEIGENDIFAPDCDTCKTGFWRAVFLCNGTVNSPESDLHLEIKLPSLERCEWAKKVFRSNGIKAYTVRRGDASSVYMKKSEAIGDFMTVIGATDTLFELINKTIEKDIRNNENRATNCVTRNIQKTVKASVEQIEAIEYLIENGLMESLPEELAETAKLRRLYDDLSLSDLAKIHDTKISKSGLVHRLEKIKQYADDARRTAVK